MDTMQEIYFFYFYKKEVEVSPARECLVRPSFSLYIIQYYCTTAFSEIK